MSLNMHGCFSGSRAESDATGQGQPSMSSKVSRRGYKKKCKQLGDWFSRQLRAIGSPSDHDRSASATPELPDVPDVPCPALGQGPLDAHNPRKHAKTLNYTLDSARRTPMSDVVEGDQSDALLRSSSTLAGSHQQLQHLKQQLDQHIHDVWQFAAAGSPAGPALQRALSSLPPPTTASTELGAGGLLRGSCASPPATASSSALPVPALLCAVLSSHTAALLELGRMGAELSATHEDLRGARLLTDRAHALADTRQEDLAAVQQQVAALTAALEKLHSSRTVSEARIQVPPPAPPSPTPQDSSTSIASGRSSRHHHHQQQRQQPGPGQAAAAQTGSWRPLEGGYGGGVTAASLDDASVVLEAPARAGRSRQGPSATPQQHQAPSAHQRPASKHHAQAAEWEAAQQLHQQQQYAAAAGSQAHFADGSTRCGSVERSPTRRRRLLQAQLEAAGEELPPAGGGNRSSTCAAAGRAGQPTSQGPAAGTPGTMLLELQGGREQLRDHGLLQADRSLSSLGGSSRSIGAQQEGGPPAAAAGRGSSWSTPGVGRYRALGAASVELPAVTSAASLEGVVVVATEGPTPPPATQLQQHQAAPSDNMVRFATPPPGRHQGEPLEQQEGREAAAAAAGPNLAGAMRGSLVVDEADTDSDWSELSDEEEDFLCRAAPAAAGVGSASSGSGANGGSGRPPAWTCCPGLEMLAPGTGSPAAASSPSHSPTGTQQGRGGGTTQGHQGFGSMFVPAASASVQGTAPAAAAAAAAPSRGAGAAEGPGRLAIELQLQGQAAADAAAERRALSQLPGVGSRRSTLSSTTSSSSSCSSSKEASCTTDQVGSSTQLLSAAAGNASLGPAGRDPGSSTSSWPVLRTSSIYDASSNPRQQPGAASQVPPPQHTRPATHQQHQRGAWHAHHSSSSGSGRDVQGDTTRAPAAGSKSVTREVHPGAATAAGVPLTDPAACSGSRRRWDMAGEAVEGDGASSTALAGGGSGYQGGVGGASEAQLGLVGPGPGSTSALTSSTSSFVSAATMQTAATSSSLGAIDLLPTSRSGLSEQHQQLLQQRPPQVPRLALGPMLGVQGGQCSEQAAGEQAPSRAPHARSTTPCLCRAGQAALQQEASGQPLHSNVSSRRVAAGGQPRPASAAAMPPPAARPPSGAATPRGTPWGSSRSSTALGSHTALSSARSTRAEGSGWGAVAGGTGPLPQQQLPARPPTDSSYRTGSATPRSMTVFTPRGLSSAQGGSIPAAAAGSGEGGATTVQSLTPRTASANYMTLRPAHLYRSTSIAYAMYSPLSRGLGALGPRGGSCSTPCPMDEPPAGEGAPATAQQQQQQQQSQQQSAASSRPRSALPQTAMQPVASSWSIDVPSSPGMTAHPAVNLRASVNGQRPVNTRSSHSSTARPEVMGLAPSGILPPPAATAKAAAAAADAVEAVVQLVMTGSPGGCLLPAPASLTPQRAAAATPTQLQQQQQQQGRAGGHSSVQGELHSRGLVRRSVDARPEQLSSILDLHPRSSYSSTLAGASGRPYSAATSSSWLGQPVSSPVGPGAGWARPRTGLMGSPGRPVSRSSWMTGSTCSPGPGAARGLSTGAGGGGSAAGWGAVSPPAAAAAAAAGRGLHWNPLYDPASVRAGAANG